MWTALSHILLTDEWMDEVDLLALVCSVNIDLVLAVNHLSLLE